MPSTLEDEDGNSIAGVVLAAGDSKRFGQPKQLLEFAGKTFIENVIDLAILSGLDPVIVVIGANAHCIRPVLEKYEDKIQIIENKEWQKGQSESLRVAINSLSKSKYALFLLVDQPQVTQKHIENMISVLKKDNPKILATFVGEKRTNPVAFSSELFGQLAMVQGDQGGRALFSANPIQRVQAEDVRLLIDVDTHEDYQKLKDVYGK